MPRHAEPAALTELVDAMLEFTAPITQVLDHMVRAPGEPDVNDVVAVLKRLLRDVLAPLGTVLAPRDLRTATAVIEASVPLIVENLYLVPHEPRPARARDPRDAHAPHPAARTRRRRGRE